MSTSISRKTQFPSPLTSSGPLRRLRDIGGSREVPFGLSATRFCIDFLTPFRGHLNGLFLLQGRWWHFSGKFRRPQGLFGPCVGRSAGTDSDNCIKQK